MSPDDYRRAGEVFDRLRELPDKEASAALESAAADNAELRAAVERLLAADRKASGRSFLEHRAIEDAAHLLGGEQPGLPASGTVIGNYRLGRRIGAGGMGVVFDAQDLRLNRRVAVKVLPQPLASDTAERTGRFQQEARAASLLNHPNIVSIFDADHDKGFYYIAMEYVEGETVRERLAADPHGLDARTVLDWIGQAASALSAAHDAGIIHRDIKPENIMVRPDGFVKVLDFGLAKLRERSGDDNQAVSAFRTRPGHLAGTIHYLSPEQVAGKRVDARSDLFSLGVVAFELATGLRPFDGPTDGAIFDAILNQAPAAPSAIRPALGGDIDALVIQALEKDPELRFQTAGDLRSCCKRLSRESSRSGSLPGPEPRRWRGSLLAVVVAAGLVCLGAGAAWLWLRTGSGMDPEARQPSFFEWLTDGPGEESYPCISADGKQFIYSSAMRGHWDIYFQRTGGNTSINLTQSFGEDSTQPALSPDGSRIAFRSEREGGGLFVMEVTGENPRRLTAKGYLPSWAPDSRHVVYSEANFVTPSARNAPVDRLYIVDTADGSERILKTADAIQPNWSPHGQRIAYWAMMSSGRRDIFTIAASGQGLPVPVTSDPALDWYPVWSPSGRYLYFLSDRGGPMNVWRVRIDEDSGRTLGLPEPVTVPAPYVGSLSLAGDGKTFVYSQTSQRIAFGRVGFDLARRAVTGRPESVGGGVHTVSNFSFSPDGSKIVFDTVGAAGSENLWIMNVDGSGRRRLTSGAFIDRAPAWSPNGEEVLFFSNRAGRYDDWIIRPDGSGLRQVTSFVGPFAQKSVWSPDGTRMLAGRAPGAPVLLDAHAPGLIADPPPAPGLIGQQHILFNVWQGELASGERTTGHGSDPEIVLYSAAQAKLEQTGLRGRYAVWPRDAGNRDQRYLLFMRGGGCFLYDRLARHEVPLFSIAPNRFYALGSPPGGGRIYYSEVIRDGDLWLARFEK